MTTRRAQRGLTAGTRVKAMVLLAVVSLMLPWLAEGDAPPQLTVIAPSATGPRTPGTGEFSRDVLGDPWDFDTLSDATLYYNMGTPTVTDGVLTATATTNDPYFYVLHNGYASAQTVGRTGITYPIDPAVYRLFSIRMNVSASSAMYIYWYRGSALSPGATQHVSSMIPVAPGWAVYRVRMDSVSTEWLSGGGGTNLIHGLRIDPTLASGSTIQIDWIRLSEPGTDAQKATISWVASDDVSAVVRVFHDMNPSGFGGQLIWGPVPATGQPDSIRWSTAHLPHPGGYIHLLVTDGVNPAVRAYAPGPLKVNDVPRIVIDDPDETGEEEFGLEMQADAWDMSNPEDVGWLDQIANPTYSGGVLWGTTSGDDPKIAMALLRPINARRYGAARIRQWVNHWTVMRLLWRHTATSSWHTTDDFVMHPQVEGNAVYGPGWNEYVVADMASLIMEPSTQPWSGYIGSIFRIDPAEHAGYAFGVDEMRLMTHDMADSAFTLRWSLTDADDSVDLHWHYTTSVGGSDSNPIATLLDVAPGDGSFAWDMSGLPSGSYYVSCTAADGLNTVTHRSRGVLILNRKPSFLFTQPDGNDAVPPGGDYPTDTLGNPWDMDSPADVDVLGGFNPDSTTWSNGIFRSVSSNNDPYFLWLPPAPIQASTHPTISFGMYLDDPLNRTLTAVVNWYANGQWWWTNGIPVSEGWHVYVVDLGALAGWSGDVTRLRLDPVSLPEVVIALDWVRLPVPGSSTFSLAWNDGDPDDDALIGLWGYQGSWGGAHFPIAENLHEDDEADQLVWDVSFLPEGSYYLAAAIDDGINLPDTVHAAFPLSIAQGTLGPVPLSGSLSNSSMLLTWSPPHAAVSQYRVYRASIAHFLPSQPLLIATVPSWQTFYSADLGEALGNPDLNFYFRVTWVNQQQVESLPSNTVGEFDFETPLGQPNR